MAADWCRNALGRTKEQDAAAVREAVRVDAEKTRRRREFIQEYLYAAGGGGATEMRRCRSAGSSRWRQADRGRA